MALVCSLRVLRNGALTGLKKRLRKNVMRRAKRFWLDFQLRQKQHQTAPPLLLHLSRLWSIIRKNRNKPT